MRFLGTLRRVIGYLLRSDSGRRHPGRVLARFAWLQFWRALLRRPFGFTSTTGTRAEVRPRGNFHGLSLLYYFELPDHEENAFACHLLRPGDVFWDVGANLGYWCLLLAGRGVEVHGFEPVPATFAEMSRQFALQAPDIRACMHGHHTGLGAQCGGMRFTADLGTANRLLAENETYGGFSELVKVTTLDAVAIPAPMFLKIDVEGWTVPVLEGGEKVLSNPKLLALLVETFRFANAEASELRRVEAILAGYGFTPHRYDPVARTLRALVTQAEGRQDTIYVRDPAALAERLREAEPVRCFSAVY